MEKEIKIIKAETCSEEDSVINIAKTMKKNNTRRVFVLSKEKKLLGIVTTLDIVTRVVAENKEVSKVKVKDIMTKNVKYITAEENVEDALRIMNTTHSYVCPILKDDKFLGVLSYHNILYYLKKHLH